MDPPANKNQARNQVHKLIRSCQKTMKSNARNNNTVISNADLIKIAKGTSRILNLCSNYIPNEAHNNDDVHQLIRYVLGNFLTKLTDFLLQGCPAKQLFQQY